MLPDESRIAVLVWQEQLVDGDDFAALAALGDGEIVRLTQGAVMRLRNEVPLRFGDTPIPTENLAPDFPGSYGLWLKRAGGGWRLVFNHEADSWGTQHDPAFDAAEIDLEHSENGLATRPLGAVLVPVTAHAGRPRHPLGRPTSGRPISPFRNSAGRHGRPTRTPRADAPVPWGWRACAQRLLVGRSAMNSRSVLSIPALLGVAVMGLGVAPAAGQDNAPARAWQAPRTPDGQPEPAGPLDQRDDHAVRARVVVRLLGCHRARLGRRQGVLHRRGSGRLRGADGRPAHRD